MILSGKRVFYIQKRTYLPTDIGTVIHTDTIIVFDIDNQSGMLPLGTIIDAPEFESERCDGGFYQLMQCFLPGWHDMASCSGIRHLSENTGEQMR
ncbi:hypothetical protein GCM10010082_30870 [Kushneria pakistanensis]|uniref:Uncharacterized protein n=1 Tax=Kushneria pakistanensis TaxID=1508770 RepID=A0ABQ3FQJ5_9GAMM|nr:hypothetical protein GCM10010082_30870 [Kushneria pakistanensis]